MSFAEKLQKCPLIAILRGITPAEIDAVCEVLYESGRSTRPMRSRASAGRRTGGTKGKRC